MRIAVVTPHYPPVSHGGISESVRAFVRELSKRYEVRVYWPRNAIWISGIPIFLPRVEEEAIYCHGIEFPSSLVCMGERGLLHVHAFYEDCSIFDSPVRRAGCFLVKGLRRSYRKVAVVAEWLLELFPNGEVVRPIIELPEPGWRGGDYLLYVGKLAREKGFDDFLRLVREVGLRGVAVGGGANREDVRGRVGNVELLGWVPREELLKLMSSALAVVSPSRCEGFSLTAAESVAMGVPFIGRDIPGIREVVGESYPLLASSLKGFVEHVRSVLRGEIPKMERERLLRLMDPEENVRRLINLGGWG
ncbi:MAG: glycosyltransferase family 4 protein [Candidatus Korarchaeum sp.]